LGAITDGRPGLPLGRPGRTSAEATRGAKREVIEPPEFAAMIGLEVALGGILTTGDRTGETPAEVGKIAWGED
jgi:hypothetical protein